MACITLCRSCLFCWCFQQGGVSILCIIFFEQITLPVSLAVWEKFWDADFPEILDAFLQLLLHLLLLLFFRVFAQRSSVLPGDGAGCGSGQCFQRQGGGSCRTDRGQRRGARLAGQGRLRAVQGCRERRKGVRKRFIVQVKSNACVILAADVGYMWVIYVLLHCSVSIWFTEARRRGCFASCR